jgi:competence ComEA-like helix-hairpin-helix protein
LRTIIDFLKHTLIFSFRVASLLFLLIYPISRLILKILGRPWMISTLCEGIHSLLKPLRDLSAYRAYPTSMIYLEAETGNPRYLLPPPKLIKEDLNTATVQDLKEISGVGLARAVEIVKYRQDFGPYRRIEELKMISGIGVKTIKNIGDRFEVYSQ